MNTSYMSRRNFLKNAGLAGATLAFAACAPAPTATVPDAAAPAGESVSLVMWGWWDLRMAFYEQVANAFSEENPDVTITVESLPGSELQQKVYSSVAAGTGPNLLKMGDDFFFRMRDEDILLEFPEDIFPNSWFAELYPGFDLDAYGRYVLPTAVSGTVLIYNKRMFEEAGLDPDTPPTTWDEFIETAKVVTQRDASGITRVGFVASHEYPGLSQVYQLGGNILDNSGDSQVSTIDSDEVVRAFQHLSDLALVHDVWDPTFPGAAESVGSGLAAMTEEQSWIIGEFAGTYADIYPDLGFAPNPTPDGTPDPYLGYKSTVLSVSALSGKPSEEDGATFRYLEYLYKDAGKDAFWGLAQLLSCAPVRADLADDPRLQENPALRVVSEVAPLEKDPIHLVDEMNTLWADTLNTIVLQNVRVEEALATLHTQWQELLDQGLATNMR